MHKGSRAKGKRKHSHSKDYNKGGKRKASREDELLPILKLKNDPIILILDHVQDLSVGVCVFVCVCVCV